MEPRTVRYCAVVAHEINFTTPASILHVAQPATNRQVQVLEQELGVTLLLRGPRGITLTPSEVVLLQEAQMLLKSGWRLGRKSLGNNRSSDP